MKQPLIIEKNTIVECSAYTSTDKQSGSEWTTNLITPLTINTNDNIIIKQCFLDTQQFSTTSIEISRDMNINLQFIYYYINSGIGMYNFAYNQPTGEPHILELTDEDIYKSIDGQPYMLASQDILSTQAGLNYGRPIVEQFQLFLEKGIYEKSQIGNIVSRQLQQINPNLQNNVLNNQRSFTTAGRVAPLYDTNNNFINFTQPINPTPQSQFISTMTKQLFFMDIGVNDKLPFYGSLFYINNDEEIIFCKLVPMCNPGQNNYTNFFNKNNVMVPIGSYDDNAQTPEAYGELSFTYEGETFNGVVYDAGFIGSTIPDLNYNDNNNNRFSFTLHTPFLDEGNPSVAIFNSPNQLNLNPSNPSASPLINNDIILLQAQCGLMLVNYYDNYDQNKYGSNIDFFSILGFQFSDLIPSFEEIESVFAKNNNLVDDSSTTKFYFDYMNTFKTKTTNNYLPISSLIKPYNKTFVPILPMWNGTDNTYESYKISLLASALITPEMYGYNFVQSSNFNNLIASSNPLISLTNAGHYLLEINGWNSGYVNQNNILNVKCLIGSYLMSSDSFAQTLGNDGTYYTHYGLPYNLSSLKIRILNPITKEPAQNIGANSSIYLQIVNHQISEE
jgi:hypothetical protein